MNQVTDLGRSGHQLSTRDQIERVVDAGQRMLSSRFDLLSLEVKQTISAALKMGLLTSVGAVLLLLGHIAGSIAAALGMALVMPAWLAVLIVAGIQFVLGGVAAVIGIAQKHSPRLGIGADEAQQVQRRLPSPTTGRPLVHRPSRPLIYRPQQTS